MSDDKKIIPFWECRKMHPWESKFSKLSRRRMPLGARATGPCPSTGSCMPTFPQNTLLFSELLKPLFFCLFFHSPRSMVFATSSSTSRISSSALFNLMMGIYKSNEHARFWDADGKRKWAVFSHNSSSHNHIYNAKYVFSIRADLYKNVGDTTVLANGMFSSGCCPRLKIARA